MKRLTELEQLLIHLRLSETAKELPNFLEKADKDEPTYVNFLFSIFEYESLRRQEKATERRLRVANFPYHRTLDEFNLEEQPSLTKRNFNKLSDLTWIEQNYNLVLLGPTGTGKTFLSVGLGLKAVYEGYKVVFISMGEMVHVLKTSDLSYKSRSLMKHMKTADLLILDDLMFMAMDKEEANQFFHFINDINEQTSIILTSNKSPNDWGELIGDEIITGAILDRIIQKAEIIQLSGDSYRMKHKKGIFDKSEH